MRTKKVLLGVGVFIAAAMLPAMAVAQDAGTPPPEVMKDLYPGASYSPYAARSFPSRVYWGETHVHTGVSLDAGLFGNTTSHDLAYRFARGEEVVTASGLRAKLSRPLDWLVVTDHSDMMGFATDIQDGAPNILAEPKGKEWHEAFQTGGTTAGEAAVDMVWNYINNTLPDQFYVDYRADSPVYARVWDYITRTADEFYDPGTFTTLIGFEWTCIPDGNNLHRNVVLRDAGDRARQVIPLTTIPPFGTTDPLDLYAWLEAYEAKTGGQALALAHNGNMSNGWMFPTDQTYAGGKVDKNYVELRAKWEPMYEVTQIKGDGEAHPFLSPEDEFADFETWDKANLNLTVPKEPDMLQGDYAREALKQGLALEEEFGTNPYKFALVGATDTHTSLATAAEENFFGKSTSTEPSTTRMEHPFATGPVGSWEGYQLSASGYQGVWATENTREALFDAMMRKETYATTGPRMAVRFFGGWEFTQDDIRNRAPAFAGYEKGVPMGGDLRERTSGAPTFMVYALRDPIGANLDRIQIIKGWLDANGETRERIYDVAVSDGRQIGTDGRARTPVGNTVDLEAASWTNTIGGSELATVWTDPDFDPAQSAFYYARVLEIPTPRWVVYDNVRLGAEIPEEAELIFQERAYTSPIWYTPN